MQNGINSSFTNELFASFTGTFFSCRLSSLSLLLIAASTSFFAMPGKAFSEETLPLKAIAIPDNLIVASAENSLEKSIHTHEHGQYIENQESPSAIKSVLEPFTGKIKGNRVRLRLSPNLDSPIVRELSHGDLWIVTGEVDDFYAVLPDPQTKAYIFRAYVLDGVVEATNVNIRLKPDTQAPVLTQLSQGDKVEGVPSKENPKWMEIALPTDIRFYIAKEYVQRVGNRSYYAQMTKSREEIQKKFQMIEAKISQELQKPFQDIQLAPLANELKSLSSSASKDFPEIAHEINKAITQLQEEFLKLSMVQQTKGHEFQATTHTEASASEDSSRSRLEPSSEMPAASSERLSSRWSTFSLEQQEQAIVQEAISKNEAEDSAHFYEKEKAKATTLRGTIVPYERLVKNRPGDFILLDATTKVPLAYLYSTHVSLRDFIGTSVVLSAVERPNHHFALPAYYVLEISHQDTVSKSE